MTILRRTLLLWLFLFWQGGFLFYSAVVVAVGSSVLGHFDQGLITRIVTRYLNLIGLVTLLAWMWDLAVERETCWKRRCATWLFLVLTLAALAWLHPQMDALIDLAGEQPRLRERAAFRYWHRWYLYLSTVQWIAAIVFSFWTLQNWRAADRSLGNRGTAERILTTPD